MDVKKVAIGCDHAGFELKEKIKKHLQEKGYEVTDFGTDSDESVDYPDYVHPLATAVEKHEFELGIIMCGSGNGVSMAANKHKDIRAALCWTEEIAKLAREHNNANVLTLPARFMESKEALKAVDTFLTTDFEGGRHERRVNKIPFEC